MFKILGDRIKELRIEKNLTQEQMADRISVTLEAYIRIEDGTINIPLTILDQIAKVLEVRVADITKVLGGSTIVHALYPSRKISDMLDLFYANKHLYAKLNGFRAHSPSIISDLGGVSPQ